MESYQQEVRGMILRSVMTELNNALRDAPENISFDKVLRSPKEDWEKTERGIKQMVRHRVYLMVTSEYHKPYYRLWLGFGPNFGAQLAREHANALKDVWMSSREFDQLKSSGADMKMIWAERIQKKFRREQAKTA